MRRAARRPGHKGLAVLLVEPSAYLINIEKPAGSQEVAVKGSSRSAARAKCVQAESTIVKAATTRAPKGYAEAHGSKRSTTEQLDSPPGEPSQPPLDVEAEDEGLLVFVQTTKCRRKV